MEPADRLGREALQEDHGFPSPPSLRRHDSVALLIHSLVDFNLQIPANAAMFVVMLALGWVCRYCDLLGLPRSDALRTVVPVTRVPD